MPMEYNFGIDMANYSRFYALLGKLPVHSEGMKEEFVSQYTGGRTTSLRCMTAVEYETMCRALEDSLSDRNMLRANRSSALRLMQRLGIDTSDWSRVNAFCMNARIAGMPFYKLDCEDLQILAKKLRTIERGGGLRKEPAERGSENQSLCFSMIFNKDKEEVS